MDEKTRWIEEAFAVIELGVHLMPYEQFREWRGVRAALESCPISDERASEIRTLVNQHMAEINESKQAAFEESIKWEL